MIDSTNPRSMADNIRKLWDKFSKISGDLLPSRFTATTGQILKLTGETKTPAWADEYRYTPPAYSETETATGQKWIDGRDIYCKVITGNFPTLEAAANVTILTDSSIDVIIDRKICYYVSNVAWLNPSNALNFNNVTGVLMLYSVATSYSEQPYFITIYYVKKTTPGRGPEDEPEVVEAAPEEKKTTKKKTSK